MKIIHRGIDPANKENVVHQLTCKNCTTVIEVTESELLSVGTLDYQYYKCPVCRKDIYKNLDSKKHETFSQPEQFELANGLMVQKKSGCSVVAKIGAGPKGETVYENRYDIDENPNKKPWRDGW